MLYRSLGRAGVKVSQLCLGTMMFGGATDEATSIRIIHDAIDRGINFIDTANMYSLGESELASVDVTGRDSRRTFPPPS